MPRKRIPSNNECYSKPFPSNLRKLMEETSTTQQVLADALGVQRQTISYYCDGSSSPNWEGIANIAKFFSVSVDWLLGLSQIRTTNSSIKESCECTGLSEETTLLLHYISQNDTKTLQGIDAILSHSLMRNSWGYFSYMAIDSAKKQCDITELLDYVPKEKKEEITGYLSQWGGKLLSPYQLFDYYTMRAVNCLQATIEEICEKNCGVDHVIEAAMEAGKEAAKELMQNWVNSDGIN